MIYSATRLKGVFIIDLDPIQDDRGFFARCWCKKEFEKHGLNPNLSQCNLSVNNKRGTLRGLHYQLAPFQEIKLVRCTRGSIYDVVVDMRLDSETYQEWISVELSADNRRMLYVPEGFAHGYQTLEDNSEIFYQVSECYHPECEIGVRWDDPVIGTTWPEADRIISAKDRAWPDQIADAISGIV